MRETLIWIGTLIAGAALGLLGLHWLDLKRWKILVKTIKNSALAKNYPQYSKQNIDFKHYRFPIPQAQREVNPNLWQNYGYDGSDVTANPYVGRE